MEDGLERSKREKINGEKVMAVFSLMDRCNERKSFF